MAALSDLIVHMNYHSTLRIQLESDGIITITADLLDRKAVAVLPDAANVMFMVGRKFHPSGAEHLSWAMNPLCPDLIADPYQRSRFIAFSSYCVCPLRPVNPTTGPTDAEPTGPPSGDPAWSADGQDVRLHENNRSLGRFQLGKASAYSQPEDSRRLIWQ